MPWIPSADTKDRTVFLVLDWVFTLLPLIAIFGAGAACPLTDAGESIGRLRPPKIVFPVVWSILALALGVSWTLSTRQNGAVVGTTEYVGVSVTYGLLVASLVTWSILRGCEKRKDLATYLFVAILGLVFMCFAQGNVPSKMVLAPLIGWLLYAFAMSSSELLLTTATTHVSS